MANRKLLKGRVAIVTGGGSGIGRAICEAFAEEGASVAVLDLNGDSAEKTARSINGLAIELDVSDSVACGEAVNRVASGIGQPTVLVYSAAYFAKRVPLADLADDVWQKTLNVNITGSFNMCKHCIPIMIEAGGGSIVHISSTMANVANYGQTAYCSSKGGLTMLSKGIALDYAKSGIRSNTVQPGGIATQGMADLYGGDMQQAELKWGEVMHPMGRLGRIKEVADAAVFLASDMSSFVTGVDLPVDGGYLIR